MAKATKQSTGIALPTLNELLAAGVHFGHQTRRWNPKMADYVFAQKKGIHIFDLEKTHALLKTAAEALEECAATGKPIVFVCTKRQCRQLIADKAQSIGVYSVTSRWLGGLLTNFETVQRSLKKYKQLITDIETGKFSKLSKKEQSVRLRQKTRLDRLYGGLFGMEQMPAALVIIDAKREMTAVREGHALGIPVIAVVDTNGDPTLVTHVVPANDDAFRSVSLITDVFVAATARGLARVEKEGDAAKPVTPDVSVEPTIVVHRTPVLPVTADMVEEVLQQDDTLAVLKLSGRSLTALSAAGITSLPQLIALTEEELDNVKGLGKKSVAEIRLALAGLDA